MEEISKTIDRIQDRQCDKHTALEVLDRKVDDLENRQRRINFKFYSLTDADGKTALKSEELVTELRSTELSSVALSKLTE